MDRPGQEIPKEFRQVAQELFDNQGWGYDAGRARGGHPTLYPADKTKGQVQVPTTPGDRRSFANWIAQIRRAGGVWPPPPRRK